VLTTTTAASYVFDKRHPAPSARALLPRGADVDQIEDAVGNFMTLVPSSVTTASPVIYQSLSSACSCADFGSFYTNNVTVTAYVVVSGDDTC